MQSNLKRTVMDLNEIESYVYYDNGKLFWKSDKNGRIIGNEASHKSNRYLNVKIGKSFLKVHRVVFMMHYGWCPQILDHINGDRYDNRIENLRMSDYSSNNMNARGNRNTTSRYKGVNKDKKNTKKPWKAQIQCNKKKYPLGHHVTEEAAARAYDVKAKELFGEYAVLNFP